MDSRFYSRSYHTNPEPTHYCPIEQDDIPEPPPDYSPTYIKRHTSSDKSSKPKYSDKFVKEYKRLRKIRKALRSKSA